MNKLMQQFKQLDGKSYKGYKDIQGHYKYNDFDLYIDYVQGDPFATPSKIRIVVPQHKRQLDEMWLATSQRKTATEDVLARYVGKEVAANQTHVKGSGKSGQILFDRPGQEVLERSAVQVSKKAITVCISVGLPANGRRINGREAEKLFASVLPTLMKKSIFTITDEEIKQAVQLADQQTAVREAITQNGWIAFIANGSILPRESGVSQHPRREAVPFQSPSKDEVAIRVPHQTESIKGMAVQKGITLIVGGGYHGKSTLLEAVERGVYYHTQGDGREFVLTDPDAVKIRAEDGRQVTGVNISPFIQNLPHQQDTSFFSTENASGSTSQAANVMEALEAGATTLLIDEDTSATNFMIRDHRMQQLVHSDKEPITPFIDRIKQLYEQQDVSTILVMGGSGDYFAVADNVLMMDAYLPYNVTDDAKKIVAKYPLEREEHADKTFGEVKARSLQPQTLQTKKGNRPKTDAKGLYTILMGRTEITFADTEQLVDSSQTRMIAEIIQFLDRTNGLKGQTVYEMLDQIEQQMDSQGLSSFTAFKDQHPGDIARPRRYEIAAVFNRIRTAKVKQ